MTYCHLCKKFYHHLGITKHRAMHKRKKEDCAITFTRGNTESYKFSESIERTTELVK